MTQPIAIKPRARLFSPVSSTRLMVVKAPHKGVSMTIAGAAISLTPLPPADSNALVGGSGETEEES